MSLRVRINLLVTGLMLAFVIVLGAVIVDATRHQIQQEIEASTKVAVRLLTTVVENARVAAEVDQVALVRGFLDDLGRVRANEIRLLDAAGQPVYVSPPSVYKAGRYAPDWFAALVGPSPETTSLPLGDGRLVIVPDDSRAILDAWDDMRVLLIVAVLLFATANLIVFWGVGRLLRPVQTIVSRLSEMKGGHFDGRLPLFALPDISAISETFNRVADALDRSSAESQRLARVVKQTSDAMLIVDEDGRIVFSNPAAERLLGYDAATLHDQPLSRFAPPGKESEIEAQLAATRRGETIDHVETQRVAAGGKVVDVSLSAAPLTDPRSGEVLGQICSLRDITEKKRAEEAARELRWNRQLTHAIQEHVEQERRALARELHDECSQYATAVRTIGMTIANRAGENAPEIRSQALTVVSVAGQLYDTVRNMIHKLRASPPHRFGLARALEEAVTGWQARHPDIAFELALAGALETVPDEQAAAAYRIVQESLNNVVRHAGATRVEIDVRCASDGTTGTVLRVAVSDNGRGLAECEDRDGGFGLIGMRERVEVLHGEFRIDSRPNRGVTVAATMPLASPRAADQVSIAR